MSKLNLDETMLYDFQKKIVRSVRPSFLIGADTGTGKTLMGLHHYLIHSKGEPLLIVAPPAKIKEGGWEDEIRVIEEAYGVKINFDQVSYYVLKKRYKLYKDHFVIFDECHLIKNPTSQMGKSAYHLTKIATNFLLLSATPAPNGIEDMINYFIMFGYARNKTSFNREYAVFERKFLGTHSFQAVVDYRQKDKLLDWYQSFTVTIKKDEALDLPPLMFKKVRFKPSKEYKTIEKDRVLDDIAYDSLSKLAHGLRAHANIKDKAKYLEMILEGTEENIVIFYNYNLELETLKEVIKDKQVFEVNGNGVELPDKKRWDKLKNTVTLVQYQAGSAGIELQYASVVVYYSPTYSYQNYAQSLGRTHRNGQKNKVSVFQFETIKTIEEKIWSALDRKEDFDYKLYLETRIEVDE